MNGDIVKLGRALGVETPYNEVLWRVADDMAAKGERPGRYSAEDLQRTVKKIIIRSMHAWHGNPCNVEELSDAHAQPSS